MGITAPGTGSNLDVNGIVAQLMAVERRPLALLQQREADYQSKLSAFGTLKGALSAFQTAMQGFADPAKFKAATAEAADKSILTATSVGGGTTTAGSYAVEVQDLAQQQKIRSEGFSTPLSVMGSGTLTIQYGDYDVGTNSFALNNAKAAQTVVIAPGNNTLAGVRDAINAANIGVSATIINDGTSNKLVLTSKDSGEANSLKITVTDADGTNSDTTGLSQLAYDPSSGVGAGRNMTQVQAAQDAKLRIDGIDIVKPSNTIADAIEGLTLNLVKTNAGSPTTLTVGRDAAGVKETVEAFVKAYNTLNQALSNLSGYNAATRKGGILQGDSAAMSIQRGLRAAMTAEVGTGNTFTSLSSIGVAFQKDGSLALDATKLQTALDSGFDRIAALFTMGASATDSLITYSGAADETAAGSYAVAVSQLAARANLTGSQAADLTIIAGINDQLSVNIDGAAASITLGAGTYPSADALAAEVQSRLNGSQSLLADGVSVAVSHAGGILSLTSSRYGSASGVALAGGNGAAALLGTSPVATAGVDVAGSINGVAATGTGQVLSAAAGGPAEGLRVTVNGGALGTRGAVEFSRGYAERLSQFASDFLADEGAIASRVDGLNASIKDIDRRQEDFNRRLSMVETRYRMQFTTLDTMLGSLSQTSQFLQQQLATLPSLNQK